MSTSLLIVEVVDTERQVRQEYTFDRSPIRVGRSPLNDLPLERSFVSHCHGVFSFDSRHCEFVDLGSTNGTFLGTRQLTKNVPAAVSSQEPLIIGDLELRVRHGTSSRVETRASYAFIASNINFAPPPVTAPAPSQRPDGPASPTASLQLEVLAPLYVQYRLAWSTFFNALQQRVPSGSDREGAATELLARFPELAQEAEFRRWLGTDHSSAAGPSRPDKPLTALSRVLGGPVEAEMESAAIDRMAHLIERFAQAFVELRRGQRQFVGELALPVSSDDPLAKLQDAPALVSYLLDLGAAPGRVDDLSRAYADIMLHQVALVNGILAGAREVLAELSPASLASQASARGPVGWLLRLLGRDARWAALERRSEDLQEEKALSAVMFGRMFARAYAAAMGQTSATSQDRPNRERTGPL